MQVLRRPWCSWRPRSQPQCSQDGCPHVQGCNEHPLREGRALHTAEPSQLAAAPQAAAQMHSCMHGQLFPPAGCGLTQKCICRWWALIWAQPTQQSQLWRVASQQSSPTQRVVAPHPPWLRSPRLETVWLDRYVCSVAAADAAFSCYSTRSVGRQVTVLWPIPALIQLTYFISWS